MNHGFSGMCPSLVGSNVQSGLKYTQPSFSMTPGLWFRYYVNSVIRSAFSNDWKMSGWEWLVQEEGAFLLQKLLGNIITNEVFPWVFLFQYPLVRLKSGAKTGEGRPEVLKNGVWGTICHDGWGLTEASVFCREMGFGSAQEAIPGARFGQGKTLKIEVPLDSVKGIGRRRSKSLERQSMPFKNKEINIRILQAQTKGPSASLFHGYWSQTDSFGGHMP